MSKEAKPLQSDFLKTLDNSVPMEQPLLKESEIEIEQTYIEFPKVFTGSFYCPDCGSKGNLRPDGSIACPKCVMKVPIAAARLKSKKEVAE